MNRILLLALGTVLSWGTSAHANLITIDFTTATIDGLGTDSIGIKDSIQIVDSVTGLTNDFDMIIAASAAADLGGPAVWTQDGSGNLAIDSTGVADDPNLIDLGENFILQVVLAPVAPGVSLESFVFAEMVHGAASVSTVTDGSFLADFGGFPPNETPFSTTGTTDISSLVGPVLSGGAFGSGTVAGITSLSFNVSSVGGTAAATVPEPTGLALFGLVSLYATTRRRRTT